MEKLKELGIDIKIVITISFIIIAAIILSRLVRWLIKKSSLSLGSNLKVDPTRYKFFVNATSLVIWLFAFGAIISLIPALKTLAITIFAGAGILVAILGFAAQQAFSNIICGVFIVIFRPFRVGDMIKVGQLNYGTVEDITLRHTVILSFENKRIIIPNSVINAETIVNDSIEDSKVCRFIEFGISYDSNIDLAIKIMQEVSIEHSLSIDVRSEKEISEGVPQVNVRVVGFGDSSVNLRAYVWANSTTEALQMHSDINRSVKARFDAEGVEIPFPYRTIVYKNDLVKKSKSV